MRLRGRAGALGASAANAARALALLALLAGAFASRDSGIVMRTAAANGACSRACAF